MVISETGELQELLFNGKTLKNIYINEYLDEANISREQSALSNEITSAYVSLNNSHYKAAENTLQEITEVNVLANQDFSKAIDYAITQIDLNRDMSPIVTISETNLYAKHLIIASALGSVLMVSLFILSSSYFTLRNQLQRRKRQHKHLKKRHSLIVQTQLVGNSL